MIARGSGSIINVSSMLAFSAGLDRLFLPKRATYAATKAFVNAFTETLSNELAGTGVTRAESRDASPIKGVGNDGRNVHDDD